MAISRPFSKTFGIRLVGSNHSVDLKRVAQSYENDGQLRQHHMIERFLKESIQNKIIAVSLGMFGDGETLERSLGCPRKAKKIDRQNILELKTSWSTRPASPSELCIGKNKPSGALNIL